jgi:hypothetical protein
MAWPTAASATLPAADVATYGAVTFEDTFDEAAAGTQLLTLHPPNIGTAWVVPPSSNGTWSVQGSNAGYTFNTSTNRNNIEPENTAASICIEANLQQTGGGNSLLRLQWRVDVTDPQGSELWFAGYECDINDSGLRLWEVTPTTGQYVSVMYRTDLALPINTLGAFRIHHRPDNVIDFINPEDDSVQASYAGATLWSAERGVALTSGNVQQTQVNQFRVQPGVGGAPTTNPRHLLSGGSGNSRLFHNSGEQNLRFNAGEELSHPSNVGTVTRSVIVRGNGAASKIDIGALGQQAGDVGTAAISAGRLFSLNDGTEGLFTGEHYQTLVFDRELTDQEVQDVIDRSWWRYGAAR